MPFPSLQAEFWPPPQSWMDSDKLQHSHSSGSAPNPGWAAICSSLLLAHRFYHQGMGRSQTFPIFVLRVTLYLSTQFPSGGWKIITVSFQPNPPRARILHVHVLIQSPTLVPGKNIPYTLHFVDFFWLSFSFSHRGVFYQQTYWQQNWPRARYSFLQTWVRRFPYIPAFRQQAQCGERHGIF